MWTQIIFFSAVALLIILLLRRAAEAKKASRTVLNAGNNFGAAIGGFFSWLTNGVGALFSRLRRRTAPSGKFGPVAKIDSPTMREHKFWQEEAMSEKFELSSHFEEGERLYKSGKYDEAEQFFIKAAANNPSDPKVYARLGLLYLQTKNYSDAIEALKVAVKLDKHNPSRHYNLALAHFGNKDTQKAISAVREAITLDPVTQKYRQLLEQLLNG